MLNKSRTKNIDVNQDLYHQPTLKVTHTDFILWINFIYTLPDILKITFVVVAGNLEIDLT